MSAIAAMAKKVTENAPAKQSRFVWTETRDSTFNLAQSALPILAPGIYNVSYIQGVSYFTKTRIETDDIIRSKNDVGETLVKEINSFWDKAEMFVKHGFLHRRGYLLHGIPGTGKTYLLNLIMTELIKLNNGVVIIAPHEIGILVAALAILRSVEPNRPIMCLFEDVDDYVYNNETALLSFLDGEDQQQHVINLATTNKLEDLDDRLTKRPRRFDRIVEIKPPNERLRTLYFKEKLKLDDARTEELVSLTDGFTYAAMSDLVIATECLGKPVADSISNVKALMGITGL